MDDISLPLFAFFKEKNIFPRADQHGKKKEAEGGKDRVRERLSERGGVLILGRRRGGGSYVIFLSSLLSSSACD